jgi:hypothetical protein
MNPMMLSVAAPIDGEVRTTLSDWIPRDTGILILVGTLLVVTLGIFIWAAFFRKPPRRPHYHIKRPSTDGEAFGTAPKRRTSWFSFRKRHRHRHRQRRRNPTLAEAGGLPPVRSEEPPPTPH